MNLTVEVSTAINNTNATTYIKGEDEIEEFIKNELKWRINKSRKCILSNTVKNTVKWKEL